ncbi:UNVERIFIED_CONTAM: hypothetical protein FKN15_013141 [Acipenser sinensis]
MGKSRQRQQKLQQQQQEEVGDDRWEAVARRLAAELCPGCGEYGHTVAICPSQYREEPERPVREDLHPPKRTNALSSEGVWDWLVEPGRDYEEALPAVYGHTVAICPSQYREEPERPTPEWEEPERPTPEWEEPERPQPKEGGVGASTAQRRGSRCVHSPKKGESVRPQPKEGGVEASTAQKGGVGASTAQEGGVGASKAR